MEAAREMGQSMGSILILVAIVAGIIVFLLSLIY